MAKKTLQEAQADVESYVEPGDCFVVYQNNKLGWAAFDGPPFNGTPCAHYVAHMLGIKANLGGGGYGCNTGYEMRVRPLVKLCTAIETADVQVNDVWARLKGDPAPKGGNEPTDHCGVVCDVKDTAQGKTITIQHDSSGKKAVLKSDWSYFNNGGKFYRFGGAQKTVLPPDVQQNQVRAKFGLPMQAP